MYSSDSIRRPLKCPTPVERITKRRSTGTDAVSHVLISISDIYIKILISDQTDIESTSSTSSIYYDIVYTENITIKSINIRFMLHRHSFDTSHESIGIIKYRIIKYNIFIKQISMLSQECQMNIDIFVERVYFSYLRLG